MSKEVENEGWPKAPRRAAEREESNRRLRAARKSLAHIIDEPPPEARPNAGKRGG